MKHIFAFLLVVALIASIATVSYAAEPKILVQIQRQGHGIAIWTVDSEGNWLKTRQSGRVIGQGKFNEKMLAEFKKAIESIKWEEVKEFYDIDGAGQKYDLVINANGKEHKFSVVNPGTLMQKDERENQDAPEAIRYIMRVVINFIDTGTPKFG